MIKPKSLNILGIPHSVIYCGKPSEVDPLGREPLLGCCDELKREMRIYDADKIEDTWTTILHESLHAIAGLLRLECLSAESQRSHDELDLLALALADMLFRNGLIKLDG